jgi:hypothetical protein
VAVPASTQFSTDRADATTSRATVGRRVDGIHTTEASSVTARTSEAAGSSRRIRRPQNLARRRGVVGGDRRRWLEMRKPEMTKKTSTPT